MRGTDFKFTFAICLDGGGRKKTLRISGGKACTIGIRL